MSTLPPKPARRSYTSPATTTFDEDDYGTSDFLTPDAPKLVFGAATVKAPLEEPAKKPENVRPVLSSLSKPVLKETPKPIVAKPAAETPVVTAKEVPAVVSPTPVATQSTSTDIAKGSSPQELHPVAVSIDNALHQAPAMIDNAIQQAPVLIGNIVDHYSEQGKKDRLIANALNGSALVTLVTGVFGPMMLALPLILSIIGLGWGKKARRNGMNTTLSSIMGWTVIGVSVSGIAIFAALAGTAYLFFGG